MSIAAKWAALRPASKASAIVVPLSLVPFLLMMQAGFSFAAGVAFGMVFCLAHDVVAEMFCVDADWEDGE